MAQRALPYEYEIEESKAGLTAFGGLPTYVDLAAATGMLKVIGRHAYRKDTGGNPGMAGPADDLISGVIKSCRGRLCGGHREIGGR